MLSVSDAFMAAWRNRAVKFAVRKIKYKRRYQAGGAFVYEAAWKELPMKDFVQIGTKSASLDTVTAGVFNTSNIILNLRNSKFEWSPYNQAGVFGIDEVATAGYEPYRTQFVIEAGYELADGSDELPVQFTGYLVDFNMTFDGTFEAEISGRELDFKEANAQSISTAFTNEALVPDIGDGARKDFRTTSTGVLFTDQVRIGGTVKKEGVDYTVSETKEPGLGALISFVDAPLAAAGNLDASGIKCLANKKVEELVEAICDYCGYTASDRTIEAAAFPNLISNVATIDSQAEWKNTGYAVQDVDLDTSAGDAKTALLAIGPLTDDSTDFGSVITIDYNTASWLLKLNRVGDGYCRFLYYSYFGVSVGRPSYWVKLVDAGLGNYNLELYREEPRPEPGPAAQILLGTMPALYTWADVRVFYPFLIARDASTGRIYIKQQNGSASIDVTDTTYLAAEFNQSRLYGGTGDYLGVLPEVFDTIDGIFKADQCVYESGERDLLVVPNQWGVFTTVAALNGGTVKVETSTAPTSGGTYEAYELLTEANIIQSTLSRYVKFKLTFNHQAWNYLSPVVDKVTIGFYSSTIVIALADFTGKTCWDALNVLAGTCNYELNVDGSGHFYFRPKSTSTTPVLTLDQRDMAGKPGPLKPGWKEVRNASQVSYPPYRKEYTSDTLPEAFPSSKDIYRERVLNSSMNGFLLANDADIATGMAQLGYEANRRPKRRIRIPFRLIPFLELGDPIKVSCFINPLDKKNIFGDPLQKYAPALGESQAVFLRDVLFKVVGYNQQYRENKTDTQLEEILL